MIKQFLPLTQPWFAIASGKQFDDEWFEAVFLAVDRLHDALSAGQPNTVSPVAPMDMVGWLQDIIYTAQEAIVEIRAKTPGEGVPEAEMLG